MASSYGRHHDDLDIAEDTDYGDGEFEAEMEAVLHEGMHKSQSRSSRPRFDAGFRQNSRSYAGETSSFPEKEQPVVDSIKKDKSRIIEINKRQKQKEKRKAKRLQKERNRAKKEAKVKSLARLNSSNSFDSVEKKSSTEKLGIKKEDLHTDVNLKLETKNELDSNTEPPRVEYKPIEKEKHIETVKENEAQRVEYIPAENEKHTRAITENEAQKVDYIPLEKEKEIGVETQGQTQSAKDETEEKVQEVKVATKEIQRVEYKATEKVSHSSNKKESDLSRVEYRPAKSDNKTEDMKNAETDRVEYKPEKKLNESKFESSRITYNPSHNQASSSRPGSAYRRSRPESASRRPDNSGRFRPESASRMRKSNSLNSENDLPSTNLVHRNIGPIPTEMEEPIKEEGEDDTDHISVITDDEAEETFEENIESFQKDNKRENSVASVETYGSEFSEAVDDIEDEQNDLDVFNKNKSISEDHSASVETSSYKDDYESDNDFTEPSIVARSKKKNENELAEQKEIREKSTDKRPQNSENHISKRANNQTPDNMSKLIARGSGRAAVRAKDPVEEAKEILSPTSNFQPSKRLTKENFIKLQSQNSALKAQISRLKRQVLSKQSTKRRIKENKVKSSAMSTKTNMNNIPSHMSNQTWSKKSSAKGLRRKRPTTAKKIPIARKNRNPYEIKPIFQHREAGWNNRQSITEQHIPDYITRAKRYQGDYSQIFPIPQKLSQKGYGKRQMTKISFKTPQRTANSCTRPGNRRRPKSRSERPKSAFPRKKQDDEYCTSGELLGYPMSARGTTGEGQKYAVVATIPVSRTVTPLTNEYDDRMLDSFQTDNHTTESLRLNVSPSRDSVKIGFTDWAESDLYLNWEDHLGEKKIAANKFDVLFQAIKNVEYLGPVFEQSKNELIKLWSDIQLPQDEQAEFASQVFGACNTKNYARILAQITKHTITKNRLLHIFQNIKEREGLIDILSEQLQTSPTVQSDSPGMSKDSSVSRIKSPKEVQLASNQMMRYYIITRKIQSLIEEHNRSRSGGFVLNGIDYLQKMQLDFDCDRGSILNSR